MLFHELLFWSDSGHFPLCSLGSLHRHWDAHAISPVQIDEIWKYEYMVALIHKELV